MTEKKVILFGGTFDPIHVGHTTVGSYALKEIGAEKVIFIPAKKSPLKKSSPKASDEDRVKMIAIATAENPKFEVSDYEIKKAGANYTLDTVRYFQKELGEEVCLYWLIGADGLAELGHWYRISELIDECNLSVMYRGGCDRPELRKFEEKLGVERVAKLENHVIKTPLVEVSSTEIRQRVSKGLDISGMVHPAVMRYIAEKGLYR